MTDEQFAVASKALTKITCQIAEFIGKNPKMVETIITIILKSNERGITSNSINNRNNTPGRFLCKNSCVSYKAPQQTKNLYIRQN